MRERPRRGLSPPQPEGWGIPSSAIPWAPITLPLRPSLLGPFGQNLEPRAQNLLGVSALSDTLSVGGSQAHSATALAPGFHLPPALLAPLRGLLALFAADTI